MSDNTATASQILTPEQTERLRKFNETYITFPRFEQSVDSIHRCRTRSQYSAEPKCLLIQGDTGAGKTALIKRYLRKYPFSADATGVVGQCPVLVSSIPKPVSISGLATRLLAQLGDPFAERGTVHRLTLRLSGDEGFLNRCGVELIILDEFHHLIETDSIPRKREAADWLKSILNDTGIPIVLVGLPHSGGILDNNDQLKRRFRARKTLAPFTWGRTVEAQKEFRLFLKAVEDALGLPEPSHLSEQTTAFRFFCASRGYIATVMSVIRTAFEFALLLNAPNLSLDLLADAFEEDVDLSDSRIPNPFEVPLQKVRMVPPEEVKDERDDSTNQRRGRKKKEKSSDALRNKG